MLRRGDCVPHYDAALKMMHAHKGIGTGSAQQQQVVKEGRAYSANGIGSRRSR
jgi:hypothetical protein